MSLKECHDCPHNGRGSARCLTCKGPPEPRQFSHHGRSHVSLNAMDSETGESMLAPKVAHAYEAARRHDVAREDEHVERRRSAVALVAHDLVVRAGTEAKVRNALLRLADGDGHNVSLAAIARRLGISKQAVHAAVKRIAARNAHLLRRKPTQNRHTKEGTR